ncbi:MAG: thioesterase [Bacilli bacterium]|nr:thioesterase [Bacilli bacterium]
MLEKQYFVGPSDVDPFLDLRLSSLFKFMQDIATEHAEKLGIGREKTIDKGMFWVITRYSVDIIRMPKFLETLVVKTYPGKDMKFIFPRFFQIETLSGEIVIKASSTWVVLNMDNHNINMNPFGGDVLPHEHIDDEEKLPQKINPPIELFECNKRVSTYSDTDLNGHINNTSYINYVIDCHDFAFFKDKQIKHFDINYEHELLSGEELILSNNIQNDVEYVSGKTKDRQIFNAKIIYIQRKQ